MKGGPLRRINDRFSRSVPSPVTSLERAPGAVRDVRAKLVPLGAGDPFDAIPDVEITDDDLDAAVTTWNRVMPARVNGLLAATVVNGKAD